MLSPRFGFGCGGAVSIRSATSRARRSASSLGRSFDMATHSESDLWPTFGQAFWHTISEAFLLAAYGTFMVTWSGFEATLEMGIMKRTKMRPVVSSLVTSGLPFERRASILRSLLSGDPDKAKIGDYKEAVRLINSITQEAERNHLIHGLVFLGLKDKKPSLGFVKRITDQEFKGKWKEFTSDSMYKICESISKKTERLQDLLEISPEDAALFSNIGLILSNRLRTSPMPPDDKDSE